MKGVKISKAAPVEPEGGDGEQRRVNRVFDERSGYWSDLYSESNLFASMYQQRHAVALSFFDDLRLPQSARVLEIGCGAGWMSIDIARRGYTVDATDPAEAMLATAARHAKDAGVEERVRLQAADLHELQFQDGTFDVVIGLGVITWLHDPDRALKELHRVMKSDGHAILTVNNRYRLSHLLDPRHSPPLQPLKEGVKSILHALRLRKPNTVPLPTSYSFGRFDDMLSKAGLRPLRDAKFGFGPLTLMDRSIMSANCEFRLNERLQSRADAGSRFLKSIAAQRVVVVVKVISPH